MEYDSPNCAEYGAEKKSEGRLRLARALLVLAYIAFSIAVIVVVCVITKMPALIAILPLLLYILWLCTWRLVSYDVEYSFESGTMIFRRIYGARGRRTPREKLRLHVKDAEYVGKASSESACAAIAGAEKVYDFSSSASVPNAAVIVTRDGAGRRIAVRFDCIRRVAALMKIFCPNSELDPKDYSF